MVTAIILAAGCAARMGTAKQLLTFRGQPLIRLVTENVLKSQVTEVIVVLGAQAEAVAGVLSGLPVNIVVNPAYAEGQSTSIIAGMQAWFRLQQGKPWAKAERSGIMFVLGDQPLVTPATMDELISNFHREGGIILPYFQGKRGNPTILGEEYLPELLTLTGDVGARDIIRHHPDRIVRVEVADPGVCLDIDTWKDYWEVL